MLIIGYIFPNNIKRIMDNFGCTVLHGQYIKEEIDLPFEEKPIIASISNDILESNVPDSQWLGENKDENDQANESNFIKTEFVEVECKNFDELSNYISEEIIYKCCYVGCDKSFKYKRVLHRHMSTHSSEGSFKCNFKNCDDVLETYDILQEHIQAHEDEKLAYEETEEKSSQKLSYKSGLGFFTCKYKKCKASYPTRRSLVMHLRQHKNELLYKCDIQGCNSAYIYKKSLLAHKRIHTGEMPFRCKHPGCNAAFRVGTSLSEHMMVHTGDKPFKCEIEGCNKEFTRKYSLTEHMRYHTGVKLYECPVNGCKKKYYKNCHLSVHMKLHTSEKDL